jgi:hypothetical protein
MKKLMILMIVLMTLFISSSVQALSDERMEEIWDESPDWTCQSVAFDTFIAFNNLQNVGFHLQVNAYYENIYGTMTANDKRAAKDFWAKDGWYNEPIIEWTWGWWWLKKQKTTHYDATQWC